MPELRITGHIQCDFAMTVYVFRNVIQVAIAKLQYDYYESY